MSTHEVVTYGRDAHGYPIVGVDTIDAPSPAHALLTLGQGTWPVDQRWTVEPVRHSPSGTDRAVTAYVIRRPVALGNVHVERTATDPALWLVSLPGRGWIGTVRLVTAR